MAVKTFERYILKSLLTAMAFVFLVLLALFSFFEFLGQLSSVTRDGAFTLQQALLIAIFRAPAQAYQAVPIAVLIGALLALAQFARHSELNVLRVSGVSTARLLLVLFKAAAVMAVLTFIWGETVAPTSDQFAQGIRPSSSRQRSGLELSSGFWLKDGTTFVNIREIKANAKLVGINLYQFDSSGALSSIRAASEGDYVQPDLWRIRDVKEIMYSPSGGAQTRTAVEELWSSHLSPDILGVLNVRPDKMSALTLISYVTHLSANRQSSERYQVALWKRIVYPMTCFVMVALALPFGYFQGRSASVGLRLFSGVMLGILFYVFDGLSSSLGLINHWPPSLSALVPSCVFMVLAIGMIWWVERR